MNLMLSTARQIQTTDQTVILFYFLIPFDAQREKAIWQLRPLMHFRILGTIASLFGSWLQKILHVEPIDTRDLYLSRGHTNTMRRRGAFSAGEYFETLGISFPHILSRSARCTSTTEMGEEGKGRNREKVRRLRVPFYTSPWASQPPSKEREEGVASILSSPVSSFTEREEGGGAQKEIQIELRIAKLENGERIRGRERNPGEKSRLASNAVPRVSIEESGSEVYLKFEIQKPCSHWPEFGNTRLFTHPGCPPGS